MIDKTIRNNVLKELKKIIETKIAINIEASIYNFSKNYAESNNTIFLIEQIYLTKSQELLCIIKTNLLFIINSIKNNLINPLNIAFMKPSDLNVGQYSEIIKKKEMSALLNKPKGTNAYKCKKCKKSKCSVTEKQVLSGDEPASQFITCLECGFVFMP
jgi:DNA-directed RNA polymerase subunit M/transcription elongation factor TFIIS